MFGISGLRRQVAALEARVRRQGRAIDLLAREAGIDPATVDPEGHLSSEELALVREGKPIHAMKTYRERTGASLVEAKRVVDEATAG